MGIKFHCPQGHRLNVKDFLAGKKAVCPKCGEKVRVPFESDPAAERRPKSERSAESPVATPAAAPSATAAAASQPIVKVQPVVAEPVAEAPITPELAAQPTSTPAAPTDAIDEAPGAVWYVRPPSGGQYGPAAGDIMRGWLAEGRVTPDSLVWRAGWPDWRSAASTFPQLAALGVSAPSGGPSPAFVAPVSPVAPVSVVSQGAPVMAPTVPVAPVVPAVLPVRQAPSVPVFADAMSYDASISRSRRRRRKNADATLIVSGILVALVLVLFAILGVVLWRQSQEAPAPAPAKKPSKPAASAAEPSAKSSDAPPKVQPLEDEPAAAPALE